MLKALGTAAKNILQSSPAPISTHDNDRFKRSNLVTLIDGERTLPTTPLAPHAPAHEGPQQRGHRHQHLHNRPIATPRSHGSGSLDYVSIRSTLIAEVQQVAPTSDATVESDLAIKVLEVAAYRKLLIHQQFNDRTLQCLLACTTGSNLDLLGALLGVERLADEADTSPGVVLVLLLSKLDDGTASNSQIAHAEAALAGTRQLTDQVIVQSAQILPYAITAAITLFDGPDGDVELANALARAQVATRAAKAQSKKDAQDEYTGLWRRWQLCCLRC